MQSAELIMNTDSPSTQKQIGKNVHRFNQRLWDNVSRSVMYDSLKLKFSQNEDLKRALLDTGESTMAECSPYDRRWGVGLAASDSRVLDRSKWQGENWLGNLLMEVRRDIRRADSTSTPVSLSTPIPPSIPPIQHNPSAKTASPSSHIPSSIPPIQHNPSAKTDSPSSHIPSSIPPIQHNPSAKTDSPSSHIPSSIPPIQHNPSAKTDSPSSHIPSSIPPIQHNPSAKTDSPSSHIPSSIPPIQHNPSAKTDSPSSHIPSSIPPIQHNPSAKNSSNLWNQANSPTKRNQWETSVSSQHRKSPTKPRMRKRPKRTPKKIPAPSCNDSIQPHKEKKERSSFQVAPSTTSSPGVRIQDRSHAKPRYVEPNRKKRQERLASCSQMSNGWLLHLDSLAHDNSVSLVKLIEDTLEDDTIHLDRRKVANQLKKVKEKESKVIKGRGDYRNFYETPIVIYDLCASTTPSSQFTKLSPCIPPSIPSRVTRSQSVPSHSPIVLGKISPNSPPPFHPPSSSIPSFTKSPACSPTHSPFSVYQPSTSSDASRFLFEHSYAIPRVFLPNQSSALRSRSIPPISFAATTTRPPSMYRLNQNLRRMRESRDIHRENEASLKEKNECLRKNISKLSSKHVLQGVVLGKTKSELAAAKDNLAKARKEISAANKRASICEEEIEMSRKLRNDQGGLIVTKEGRDYTLACKRTILDLKADGLSDSKVGPVMQKVVKDLTGRSLSHIPCPNTTGRTYGYGGKALTQMHSRSIFTDQITRQDPRKPIGMSLLSDETTKWRHKLQTYSMNFVNEKGERRNHVFGMKEVSSKIAETSLRTVLDLLDKIDRSGTVSPVHASLAAPFKDLVVSYVNSAVGDRANTQLKFANLLQDYKDKIMPYVRKGWESMTAKERYVHNLFLTVPCYVHCMASLTEPVIVALARHEISITGDDELPLDNPTVLDLIRTMTTHFGPRSSSYFVTYKNYLAWCKSRGIPTVTLPSLRGNRFNVVPSSAARICAYRDHFVTFMIISNTEELQAMKAGLSDDLMSAHLLILSLIDVYVTGPLWRVSNGDINVLETHKFIGEFLEWVDARVAEPSLLFTGEMPKLTVPSSVSPFGLDNEMVKFLVTRAPTPLALEAAKVAMKAVAEFLRRVFAPFLPAGQFYKLCTAHGPTADRARASLAATPGNNIPSESTFGLVDWLMNRAPNERLSRIETDTLMRKNHTLDWLDSFTPQQQEKMLKECMRLGPTLEKEAKTHSETVTKEVCQRMYDRSSNVELINERERKEVWKLTNEIHEYGFFDEVTHLDKFIAKGLGKQAVFNQMALQLKFRKKVLSQSTFGTGCFTIKPRASSFTLEGLVEKVRQAIKKDRKIRVKTFCGKDVASSILGRYNHFPDGLSGQESYPCEVSTCRKASKEGASYALITYHCGSGKSVAVVEEMFREGLVTGGYRKIASASEYRDFSDGMDVEERWGEELRMESGREALAGQDDPMEIAESVQGGVLVGEEEMEE